MSRLGRCPALLLALWHGAGAVTGWSARPPKVGHWALAIVRAARRITAAEYKVYELILELDRGTKGCFMSQESRALQTALGVSTTRAAEQRFEGLGMLVKRERANVAHGLVVSDAARPHLDVTTTRCEQHREEA